jgi:flavorubredoxin
MTFEEYNQYLIDEKEGLIVETVIKDVFKKYLTINGRVNIYKVEAHEED